MLFSSIPFLYYFLPVVLICYFLAPGFLKNTVLLLSSLFFYAWGEPRYVILMVASIFVGYIAGLLLEKNRGKKAEKPILIIAILICLAGLLYFKYADFFLENFNAVTGMSVPLLKLALPIGISFYTFQIISYLIDVYRNDTVAQKNIISLAAYVALFAQLIAGPIVRYTDIDKQLSNRKHSFCAVSEGIKRFIVGLSKKILIANLLGELVDTFRASDEKSVGFFWLYAVAYTLHIYFDFSGYSDMAIGLGKIFGFSFPENFDHPYVSLSITEFWRRWHMTLGSWFRDYVYIPLGGNRVPKVKWFRNIFIVWMLTGFWHGADWNFILWGIFFAILLIIEKLGLLKILDRHKLFAHIYVIFMVIISFVIFNAVSLGQMIDDFRGMFGLLNVPLWSEATGYYLRSYIVIIVVGILGATELPVKIVEKLKDRFSDKSSQFDDKSNSGEIIFGLIDSVFTIGLLLVCTAFLVDGSFNPFLYFRF